MGGRAAPHCGGALPCPHQRGWGAGIACLTKPPEHAHSQSLSTTHPVHRVLQTLHRPRALLAPALDAALLLQLPPRKGADGAGARVLPPPRKELQVLLQSRVQVCWWAWRACGREGFRQARRRREACKGDGLRSRAFDKSRPSASAPSWSPGAARATCRRCSCHRPAARPCAAAGRPAAAAAPAGALRPPGCWELQRAAPGRAAEDGVARGVTHSAIVLPELLRMVWQWSGVGGEQGQRR